MVCMFHSDMYSTFGKQCYPVRCSSVVLSTLYYMNYLTIIEWGWAQYEELSSPTFAVINRSRRLRLITANWGLDNSSYCAKTEFNNCFIIYLKKSKLTEAICILFVKLKKNNSWVIRQLLSSSYQWRQRVNMILVVIVIWRKRVQIFFILTLWRHFANMNVKNPYLVSHWVDMTISQLAVSQSETRNF